MPIVTLTLRKPKTAEFKTAVLDSVHAALVAAAGVDPNDRFQRVLELAPEDFRFHPSFPDLKSDRTDDFVLVEILLAVGRSVKVKKQILRNAMEGLSRRGLDPENVMVCFQDVAWENWSAGGGRVLHA
jgi:phenylpyruvate tautomerase PptA (4-oxalocrotonate tautomerase family)